MSVEDLFVSWLAEVLPDVLVASERPAKLETLGPVVTVARGVSASQRGLDSPRIDCDFYAATRTAAAALGRRVQAVFEEQTPVGWRAAQMTWLRCNQAVLKVGDVNQGVYHYTSINTFSVQ